MSLEFKSSFATSPVYVGGASMEDIRKQYDVEEVIKIGSNESPLGPSPLAVAAMQQAAASLNRYPPMGDDDLKAVLAETLGQGLQPENFFTGNGGCDVLWMIAGGFLGPERECIICRPTFPVYDVTARRVGTNVVYVDLDPDHFTYDVEAILAAVTEKTRVIYLCSPNNPTGGLLSAEQMETLVNNVPDHVLLVTDEVYHHFITADNRADPLPYVLNGKNVVVIHSFSKAYGLAGLRLGYGIARPEIIEYLARIRLPFHLDRMTIEGGMAALRDTAYLQNSVELVVAGRQWLYEALSQLEVQVWPSQANFILFKPPFAATEVSEQLLRRGIIVRPMGNFYLPDHLRVSVGLPEENERFVSALREILAAMK